MKRNGFVRSCVEGSFLFLIVLISFSSIAAHSSAKEEEKLENTLTPQSPRYEFTLNLNEYSILNSSIVGGLKKYGGGAQFCLSMAKEDDEIVWRVTITNPKLIQVLGYWTAEKSAELLEAVDVDNLDAKSKLALATMKSLSKKVAYAHENPVYDPVQLSGFVLEEDGVLFIEGQQGKYQATGNHLEQLDGRKGKRVIAVGYIKVRDQIEVSAFLDVKVNTLELFVMSLCPFAKKAEASILEFLNNYSGNPRPLLEVHYIFYNRSQGDSVVFASMHGEKEVKENLVQIVIRDRHTDYYYEYVLERISSGNADWQSLAATIGMSTNDISTISQTIEMESDSIIRKEYEYVTGTYQIYDGSPTYVWESEKVRDVGMVPEFEELKFASDKCREKGE